MDPVEQTQAPVEHPAAPAEVTPVNEEPEQEPVHQVCQNCGYHDASGGPADRCPACYFRHASEPVHQAPVKEPETAKKEPETALEAELPESQAKSQAADLAEVEDKPNVAAVVTEGKSADEEGKSADEATGAQAVRVVEKIAIVEEVPIPDADKEKVSAEEAVAEAKQGDSKN